MAEALMLKCSRCRSWIPVVANPRWPVTVQCSTCGQTYQKKSGNPGSNPGHGSIGDILLGIFVGALFVGPFIWTPLGRATAVAAIRRGAGVTEAKVHEWLRRGE